MIQNSKNQHASKKFITTSLRPSGGLLAWARDWVLQVNLWRQLKFPENIATTLPDMVLTSKSTKQVILLELTVPWEERIALANECKRAKYAELIVE